MTSPNEVNPYEAPRAPIGPAQPTGPASMNGPLLVMYRGSRLPPNCLKCGAACNERRRQRFLYVPKEFWIVLALAGFVAIVVYFASRKVAFLEIPLCARCKRRWQASDILNTFAVLLAMGALAGLFALSWIDQFELGLVAVGVAAAVVIAAIVYAKKAALTTIAMDDRTITLRDVHPDACAGILAANLV